MAAVSVQPTKLPDGALTEHGHTVGTVAYMSPEQLRGEDVDVRTDLFSLGLVLYEMATGQPAFGGATSAVISGAILHEQPRRPRQIRPALSARLEEIILKAPRKIAISAISTRRRYAPICAGRSATPSRYRSPL